MQRRLESFRSLELVQFDNADVHVLFSPQTLQLFRLSKLAATVVQETRGGSPLSEVSMKYCLSESKLVDFLEGITAAVESAPRVSPRSKDHNGAAALGPVLGKLALMVNNYCNLKCTYCYELDTVFKKKPIDMPQEVIRTTLDKFYCAFSAILELMFIGGEPTLSDAVVEFACRYSTQCARERGCSPPSFSMITNGAKMTERMFEVIRQYEIQATFSIDGPKTVQDLVRIRHDNSGSYDAAAENIRRYALMFEDKLSIEATLTRAHKDAHVSVSELLDFFAREFGVRTPHIAAAGLAEGDPLNPYSSTDSYLEREFEEATTKSVDNLFDELRAGGRNGGRATGVLDLVTEMLRSLVKQESTLAMCPAGTTQLVVDALGDLYPCWMFAGKDQFKMGNIMRDGIFSALSMRVLQRIRDNDKEHNPQCSVCCARYVCHACIGNNQNMTGAIESIDERFCNTVRGSLKAILLKIAEARQDPTRWSEIRNGVNRSRERQGKTCQC